MSDDKPIERRLGRPLRRPEIERKLGRPLRRPALPGPSPELDDEPVTREAHAVLEAPEHWPEEEIEAPRVQLEVTEGEIVQALEWYFPLIFASCLAIVSYIGIYHAVAKLPGANPLPPAWF